MRHSPTASCTNEYTVCLDTFCHLCSTTRIYIIKFNYQTCQPVEKSDAERTSILVVVSGVFCGRAVERERATDANTHEHRIPTPLSRSPNMTIDTHASTHTQSHMGTLHNKGMRCGICAKLCRRCCCRQPGQTSCLSTPTPTMSDTLMNAKVFVSRITPTRSHVHTHAHPHTPARATIIWRFSVGINSLSLSFPLGDLLS